MKKCLLRGWAAIVITALVLVGFRSARAQTAAAQKPLMAEDAFKNVQVLRGIPASEFLETMGFFAVSLTANCTTCHGENSAGSWAKYADDTPLKQMTRKMVVMVNVINQTNFGGKREVTCFTCHRGSRIPRITASIADVYRTDVTPDEPDQLLEADSDEPSVDQVLTKYLDAIGGADRLARLTSFSAKGTSQGYAEGIYPVEIYAKAPNQLTTIIHTDAGDRTTTYDGSNGWVAMPSDDRPITLLPLIDDDLGGAKFDAELTFPGGIKRFLQQWRVTTSATIDDKDVEVVQGTFNGRTPVNLYFDPKSGLLVRQVRYSDTKVGLYATQVDYGDYRDVAGVKIPFHRVVSWLDGRTTIDLTQVQPNVPVDPTKFSRPTAPRDPNR